MMKSEILNQILANENIDINSVKQFESIVNKMDFSDQLAIHGLLQWESISNLYKFRDQLLIHKSVKEHILWMYYRTMNSKNDSVSENYLKEMINEYHKEKFVAVESAVIELIKSGKLTPDQIQFIKQNMGTKAILKTIGKIG